MTRRTVVVYVAGPIRAPGVEPGTQDMWQVQQNVMRAMQVARDVWALGETAAVCPHGNTIYFQGTLPDDTWLVGDLELLRRADAVIMVEGWEQSQGALAEHQEALDRFIPIFYTLSSLAAWVARRRRPVATPGEVMGNGNADRC